VRRVIKRKKRKKIINRRLLGFVSAIILWVMLILFIWLVDPALPGAVPVFMILVFVFLVTLLSVFVDDMRRIFLYPSLVVFFLILGLVGLGNVLNLLFLSGIAISIELYLRSR